MNDVAITRKATPAFAYHTACCAARNNKTII